MRRFFLSALAFGVAVAEAQPMVPVQQLETPAVTTLTLQECVEIGVNRSTPVLQGTNAVALSAAQVLEAYGQLFLPDLTAGAGFNYAVGNNFYSTVGPE